MREATLTLALPLDIFRHLLDLVAEPVDQQDRPCALCHRIRVGVGAVHREANDNQRRAKVEPMRALEQRDRDDPASVPVEPDTEILGPENDLV